MNHNFTLKNHSAINAGQKETPILLIHGWGGSLESLKLLQEQMANEIPNPIYNLELPGFGKTELMGEVMSTPDYAKYVVDFLKEQKLERVILAGHSFGGKVSMHIVANKMFDVEFLILIATSGIKPENTFKKSASKFLQKIIPKKIQESEKLKEIYYKRILRERDYLTAGKLEASLAKIVEEHADETLKKILIPTFIIWGENDAYVPLWMGRKLEDEIKYSKLVVVPEGTHGLPLKQPKLVADLIANWIQSASPAIKAVWERIYL